jgi:hypothetical protein
MTAKIASWNRPYHADSDGEALLFFLAFGNVAQDEPLSSAKYRCAGVPEGFEIADLNKEEHADYIGGILDGYIWDEFRAKNRELAKQVNDAPGCAVLRGSQKNPLTLDYLRDAVGLMTYFLDCGACAIYDLQTLRWWPPEEWRKHIFAPAAPVPRLHAMILFSEEDDHPELTWFHTRGMRKFGRPDISVHGVGARHRDGVIDLCNRLIEYQALGGIIPEGKIIRMKSLPPGGAARHGGDLDDPDFNNVHVEFVWPKPGLA